MKTEIESRKRFVTKGSDIQKRIRVSSESYFRDLFGVKIDEEKSRLQITRGLVKA